ncbi:MAG TPA: hypothetical protein VEW28_03110 [Candidatus Kapabacteria bacterium]|nr:hypothetical protein [Candidatus Kapabacteria bacterium]
MKKITYIVIFCAGFSFGSTALFAQRSDPKTTPTPTAAPAHGVAPHIENTEAKREALNKKLEERKVELNKEKNEKARSVNPHTNGRDHNRENK